MDKLIFLLLAISVGTALHAAEDFSSLEAQMTRKEFTAAGLDRLTEEQLAELNAWIRSRLLNIPDSTGGTATVSTAPANNDRRGLKSEIEKEDRAPITSRIVGAFQGWDGQTVFRLENGMVWAQADKEEFYIRETTEAVAVIKPGIFGTWRLHVEGYNSACRVERIR